MHYQHTQKSPLYLALLAVASLLFVVAWLVRDQTLTVFPLAGGGILLVFLAMSFCQLTIEDQGEHLAVRFGPLSVFQTRIRYSSITAVEAGRSSFIDGLGIHYTPGRGWIYNLWGTSCIVFHLGDRTCRVGTDDAQALLSFLQSKISITH